MATETQRCIDELKDIKETGWRTHLPVTINESFIK
jgi:hypothetical protein